VKEISGRILVSGIKLNSKQGKRGGRKEGIELLYYRL
jgi:hypothetical protein